MGNQLVAVAPSQIFPVEHYMTDIGDLEYETNLGSTRFFKVALARLGEDNFVVVKVFTIQDVSLNLIHHRDRILSIKKSLEGSFNCLPFVRAEVTNRIGFIVRQHIKYSLYDRLSTRPFLRIIEKKWLAFQLLLAVQQAHKHRVVHGDIKSENVLVTGWNWLLLSDFASFKPVYLPEDNPADFSYFFDTSRRRTCYVAPERFKSRSFPGVTTNNDVSFYAAQEHFFPDPANEESMGHGKLLPSMDIFSTGCCLIELFTDGSVPFTFSQLLAYRAGEYSPNKVLDKIEDNRIKDMVTHMIQLDPKKRNATNNYLSEERSKIFPEYFFTFLQSYIQLFSTGTSITADQKIFRLANDIDTIIKVQEDEPSGFDSEGLVLISSIVTANMRSLGFVDSKLKALSILVKLSSHLPDEVVLDRILPYVIDLLSDFSSSVRISAIDSLTKCVSQVKALDISDGNIFADYILPALLPLCSDKTVLVRSALARNIAEIAQASVRFLDMTMTSGDELNRLISSYEVELAELHNCMAHTVAILLSDNANLVKQSLMEYSVTKLASFFGKLKANDVLLSHMITFLNDKEDSQLRRSFYENIVGVASYVGNQCSPILLPLLQQGLSDPEEFVISSCISAMARLTASELLHKIALYELLQETVPYLLHPNLWIRQATAGFVSSACKRLDNVDIHVKIGTLLEPFLKNRVLQLSMPVLILSNLEPPIPRIVLDSVVNSPDIENLIKALEERKNIRTVALKNHQNTHFTDMEVKMKVLFRRLVSQGMSSAIEDKILHMKENLIKISWNKSLQNSKQKKTDYPLGEIDINRLKADYQPGEIEVHAVVLDKVTNPSMNLQDFNAASSMVNEEWQHMFGPESSTLPEPAVDALSETAPALQPSIEDHNSSLPFREDIHTEYDRPPCQIEINNLVNWRRSEYALIAQHQIGVESRGGDLRKFPSNVWRPRGVLIAHLHEHEGGITRLINLPHKSCFASSATDGRIRLWDCSKMEGSDLANKAYCVYNSNNMSPVNGLAACTYSNIIASASENGLISILRTDVKSVDKMQIDISMNGPPVQLHFNESGSSPILIYGTSFGSIVGWDLRTSFDQPAFKLKNELRQGLLTSLSISPDQCWAVSGSSSGLLSTWDLRFSVPVVNCVHPSEARIRETLIHPSRQATVIASTQGNNEVGIWSMESQCRSTVLWASHTPVLSTSESSSQSVCSMFCISSNTGNTNSLITGGTDMRLRYWDLSCASSSYIFAGSGTETITPSNASYESKLVDGTEVIRESYVKSKGNSSGSNTSSHHHSSTDKSIGMEDPAVGHNDCISAITMCMASRWYVVSGSRDGVIKVWK